MSFVIAVMKKQYAVVAGDTQLNDENGKITATGIKILPVDNHTVIGLVGDYRGHLSFFEKLRSLSIAQKDFNEKTKICYDLLKECCNDFNGILVAVDNKETRYSVLSSKIELVSKIAGDGEVKVLLPPDVKEEFCYPYVTSLDDLKQQAVNCIRAVGSVSVSVNEKVFGFELTKNGLRPFTDGIDYENITFRIFPL